MTEVKKTGEILTTSVGDSNGTLCFDRGNWIEGSRRNTDICTVFCKSEMVAKQNLLKNSLKKMK